MGSDPSTIWQISVQLLGRWNSYGRNTGRVSIVRGDSFDEIIVEDSDYLLNGTGRLELVEEPDIPPFYTVSLTVKSGVLLGILSDDLKAINWDDGSHWVRDTTYDRVEFIY